MLYYYLEPGSDLNNGLRELQGDTDINAMCKWVHEHKLMDSYYDHRPLCEILEI